MSKVYLTDLLAADDTSGIYYFLQGYKLSGDCENQQKILFWMNLEDTERGVWSSFYI